MPNPSCGAPHSSAWWSAERQGATAIAFEPPCDSTRIAAPVFRIVARSPASLAAALASAAWLIAGRLAAACSKAASALAADMPEGAAGGAWGTVVGAVGSLIHRESLKIAAAVVNGCLDPFLISSFSRYWRNCRLVSSLPPPPPNWRARKLPTATVSSGCHGAGW